jgi:hypothetical protein
MLFFGIVLAMFALGLVQATLLYALKVTPQLGYEILFALGLVVVIVFALITSRLFYNWLGGWS